MATLPTPQEYKTIEIKSTFPGTKSVTDTGVTQRVSYNGHFFDFQVTYPPMRRVDYQQVIGFIQGKQGSLTAFDMPLGIYADSAGYIGTADAGDRPGDDNLYVDVADVQGDTTIAYSSGWTSTYFNVGTDGNLLEIGDYITFSNHNKLYQVTAITNPDATGDGSIEISPPLTHDVPDGTTINAQDVVAKVFFNDKAMVFQGGDCGFSQIALNLKEEI